MKTLDSKKAQRLQRILSKKIGRELTQDELEAAYIRLMKYTMVIMDLHQNRLVDVEEK